MDFFALQDQATRNTRKLIFLFAMAISAIVVSLYIFIVLLFIPPRSFDGGIGLHAVRLLTNLNWSRQSGVGLVEWLADRDWWHPGLFLSVTGVTAALLACGSAFKFSQLRQGGRTFASVLGGRPILSLTKDPDERRLLNVVEEMAIASGTPVPGVYLLEQEPGINAFAAGFSRDDMVIGITQGGLRMLRRDELQGVIAHEFSHILRGDMRLNMRLLGTVSGITLISSIGYFLLRFSTRGVRIDFGGSRSKAEGGGGLGPGILVFGAALYVLGYLGVFFSNLIKSAIGRQREFLADASAVQFTRNPSGLAGALKKIGGLAQGSRIRSPHAQEASHFYFSNGLRDSYFQILATHPPLAERILRLDPSFDGEFPRIELPADLASATESQPSLLSPLEGQSLPRQSRAGTLDPQQLIESIGILTMAQIDSASGLRANLPPAILDASRECVGASAIIIALLLSSEEEIRARQIRKIQQDAPPAMFGEVTRLLPTIQALNPETKIPLIDLSVQALRNLSERQYEQFRALTETMIGADEHLDLFEFCLQRILRHRLDAHFHGVNSRTPKFFRTLEVLREALHLLSALAWLGQPEEAGALAAFTAGARQLDLPERRELKLESQSISGDLELTDRALERLCSAGPYVKKNVMLSCAHVVASDGRVMEPEHELLRAIADSLELPLPPLVRELVHV
jgi:Zn-dependent protease with chaperone function